MKILIADDEKMVRLSLISMLNDIGMDIEIVGEAKNGEELINKLKDLTPDIAFVDIKMPVFNGLEAIRIGKSVSPNTHWVILTGFSQFDYAQEAIRLGVFNYLLKPVSPEDIEEVVRNISEKAKTHLQIMNQKFESDIISLYNDLNLLHDIDEKNLILNSNMLGTIFYADSYLDEESKSKRQRCFCHNLRKIVNSYLESDIKIALFNLSEGHIATVCAWRINKNHKESRLRVYNYLNAVNSLILNESDNEFCITAFKSDEFNSYEELIRQLDYIQNISLFRILLGIGNMWTVKDMTINEQDSEKLLLVKLFMNLSECFNQNMYLKYVKTLEEINKIVDEVGCFQNIKVCSGLSKFLRCALNCKAEVSLIDKRWLDAIAHNAESMLVQGSIIQKSLVNLEEQIISYIEENYMTDISIASIADKLNVTPNYLSSLFHKKTGKKFIDYLIDIRILNAKKILQSNNAIQIKEVAKSVGYYSSRHFTKLFVKHAGCYPSEYQKQHYKR